jgi:hypothetical protein
MGDNSCILYILSSLPIMPALSIVLPKVPQSVAMVQSANYSGHLKKSA